jgi:hypothetical protein
MDKTNGILYIAIIHMCDSSGICNGAGSKMLKIVMESNLNVNPSLAFVTKTGNDWSVLD